MKQKLYALDAFFIEKLKLSENDPYAKRPERRNTDLITGAQDKSTPKTRRENRLANIENQT